MKKTIVILEALNFGLGRMTQAAEDLDVNLVLLTKERSRFLHELRTISSSRLQVIDMDTTDETAVRQKIVELGAVGLINPTDYWTNLSLKMAAEFDFPSQSADAVRKCRDKTALRNLLNDAGLSRGRAVMIDRNTDRHALAGHLSGPMIVKERSGTGSRNVWLIEDAAALERLLDEAFDRLHVAHLTMEPYFRGTLYSAETVSYRGEMRMFALSGRLMSPEPRFTEEAVITPLDTNPKEFEEISRWIKRVLDTVGYETGLAHTEFMMTPDGPEVVEINTRLGGSLLGELVCRSYRTNVYAAFLEIALGQRPKLLDVPLNAEDRYAVKLVYPPDAGRLIAVEGRDRIKHFPGRPEYLEIIPEGADVKFPYDDRGCIGTLYAAGQTSAQAIMNIMAAGNALSITMASPTG